MTRYNRSKLTRDRMEDMASRTLQDLALIHREEARGGFWRRLFSEAPNEVERDALRVAMDAEAILRRRADNGDWRR